MDSDIANFIGSISGLSGSPNNLIGLDSGSAIE
jgi:hypothetical protein